MIRRKTHGLIAAPFTPMKRGGALNTELIASYARHLHADGLVGAFICGTTGEGMSLTVGERQQVAERWVAASPRGLRIIVHVGHSSLADCRALAAHAEAIGADSIATMAPFFFKSADVGALVDWCTQVASASPGLPFYYYHMPSMTGVSLPVIDFLRAASKRIPNLAGIKYTYEDLEDYERCLRFDDGAYDVLFGRDELLLSALRLGARGAVGSTYNLVAPLYFRLMKCLEDGDLDSAVELQAVAVQMIDACATSGAHPLSTFKRLMRRVGVECGPPRLPLGDITPHQLARVEARLDAIGCGDWLRREFPTTPAAS